VFCYLTNASVPFILESEKRVERNHKWTSKRGLELKPLWLLQTSFILLHRQVQYKAEGRGIERASMSKKRFYELTLFFVSFLAILVAPQKQGHTGGIWGHYFYFFRFYCIYLIKTSSTTFIFSIYLLLCTYISYFISDSDNIWPKFSYCGLKRPYGMSFHAYS